MVVARGVPWGGGDAAGAAGAACTDADAFIGMGARGAATGEGDAMGAGAVIGAGGASAASGVEDDGGTGGAAGAAGAAAVTVIASAIPSNAPLPAFASPILMAACSPSCITSFGDPIISPSRLNVELTAIVPLPCCGGMHLPLLPRVLGTHHKRLARLAHHRELLRLAGIETHVHPGHQHARRKRACRYHLTFGLRRPRTETDTDGEREDQRTDRRSSARRWEQVASTWRFSP